MELFTMIGILVLGLFAGAVLAGALMRGSRGPNLLESEAELADLKARLEERDRLSQELRRELDAERGVAEKLRQEVTQAVVARVTAEERANDVPKLEAVIAEKEAQAAALRAEVAQLQARHASLLTRLDETEKAQAKFAETFKGVASEALAHNNQNFLQLAKAVLEKAQEAAKGELTTRQEVISETLKPLKESLDQVNAKMAELEKERAAQQAAIAEQVRLLTTAQSRMEGETAKLVNALRAPSVRGRWGEVQLRRVVEMAGMVEYCDFDEQVSVGTEDGRLRPDMIVRLPNQREIVVDAKVSLAAYLDSLEMTDDAKREEKLADHARQVRQHIQRLSAKAYWDQFERAPDFVIAFLPGETFFSAALQKDPELLEFGVENKVMLATPTTLIALLKAVAYGWRQEKMARNAQEINRLGQELYDRLSTFVANFDGIRAGLERSLGAYNRAAGSLESRVLVTARKFKELSASASDDLPAVEPVDLTPRRLDAPELALAVGNGDSGYLGD
jgi:DNA recombination protein RmuC